MTKLWMLSDLHRDHGAFYLEPPPAADVAVIAGDVVSDGFLRRMVAQIPTVFVAGNHEFYRYAYGERMAQLRDILGPALLDNSEVTIAGARFVGCTLWTNYGGSAAGRDVARRSMTDHRLITWQKTPWQRFRPEEAAKLHWDSVAYLRSALGDASPRGVPTVVVTHHAPSLRSIHERHHGAGLLNHAYASDLDYLVEGSGAAVWVHGHVHDAFDYTIGETRVICNPHGYPHEVGSNGWRPDLIVEVGNA